MKKVLLATSMLVAATGFAAAEVTLSGDGRMGVVYNGDDVNFSSRIRAKFNLSGESDSGLTFGGAFRADQATGAKDGNAASVFVSGAFGTIEMGDTVGAAEAVLFDLPEVGYTDLDGAAITGASGGNEGDFLTGDGADGITAAGNPSALYTYSFNDFTVAASLTDGHKAQGSVDDDQAYALGVKYAFGDYTIGAAYEVLDYATPGAKNGQAAWIGGTAKFNDTTVYALYGKYRHTAGDKFGWDDQLGLGVSSKFDALTVNAYVKRTSFTVAGVDDVYNYGVGAEYNLGGGAKVVGGIADSDVAGQKAIADLGLKFSF